MVFSIKSLNLGSISALPVMYTAKRQFKKMCLLSFLSFEARNFIMGPKNPQNSWAYFGNNLGTN